MVSPLQIPRLPEQKQSVNCCTTSFINTSTCSPLIFLFEEDTFPFQLVRKPALLLSYIHSICTTASVTKDKRETLVGLTGLKPDQLHKPKGQGHEAKQKFCSPTKVTSEFPRLRAMGCQWWDPVRKILWLGESSLRLGGRKTWV